MRFQFVTFAGLILAVFTGIGSAIAQQSGATISVTPFSIEGFVKGNRHNIGAEFAAQHNIAVPAPFSFIAPTSKTHLNGTQPAPGGAGIFKMFFVTLEKAVKSNIQFIPFTVAAGPAAQRLDAIQNGLRQGFVDAVPDPDRADINITRATKVGPYDALEIIGRYDGGEDGVVVLRVVGVLHPENEHGLLVIINALAKNLPMQSVEDILKTDASRALGTLKFE